MKTIYKGMVCLLLILPLAGNTQVFWEDNFEGSGPNLGGGDRNAPSHTDTDNGSDPSICGSSDYFYRTDCNTAGSGDCTGVTDMFAGAQGSFMWRGEDLDGCIADPDQIDWTGINISGRSGLTFYGLFACDDDVNEWEGVGAADGHPDYIEVLYQIDGGGYSRGMIFRSDASDPGGSGDNRGLFRVDTNDDGFGDGPTLMDKTFREFSFSIPTTGTTLDLRVVAFVNGGGEEFGFDLFQIGETMIVPVTLNHFTATPKQHNVLLEWQTANEQNNDYFDVERSRDGYNFSVIGKVDGHGTTQASQDYELLDRSPYQGKNYYRLRQVDFDGRYEYSDIRLVNFSGKTEQFSLAPNPTQDEVRLNWQWTSNSEEELWAEVYDLYGNRIRRYQLQAKSKEKMISLSDLPAGTYLVQLQSDANRLGAPVRLVKL